MFKILSLLLVYACALALLLAVFSAVRAKRWIFMTSFAQILGAGALTAIGLAIATPMLLRLLHGEDGVLLFGVYALAIPIIQLLKAKALASIQREPEGGAQIEEHS